MTFFFKHQCEIWDLGDCWILLRYSSVFSSNTLTGRSGVQLKERFPPLPEIHTFCIAQVKAKKREYCKEMMTVYLKKTHLNVFMCREAAAHAAIERAPVWLFFQCRQMQSKKLQWPFVLVFLCQLHRCVSHTSHFHSSIFCWCFDWAVMGEVSSLKRWTPEMRIDGACFVPNTPSCLYLAVKSV